ncbi:hypothetical protein D6777_03690 [Candidatus Woesearchaeota archaeon]|nr:MAG: hypothetical protein D6777_03690 [Candidatus Woesearchaeota archaeon]
MAHKIHAKQKRMNKSATHLRSIRLATRNRAKRPKTFKSEEAAKAWAEKNNIKKYELVDLKHGWGSTKKIRVKEL